MLNLVIFKIKLPGVLLCTYLLPDQDIIACQFSKQLGDEAAVGTVTEGDGRHR